MKKFNLFEGVMDEPEDLIVNDALASNEVDLTSDMEDEDINLTSEEIAGATFIDDGEEPDHFGDFSYSTDDEEDITDEDELIEVEDKEELDEYEDDETEIIAVIDDEDEPTEEELLDAEAMKDALEDDFDTDLGEEDFMEAEASRVNAEIIKESYTFLKNPESLEEAVTFKEFLKKIGTIFKKLKPIKKIENRKTDIQWVPKIVTDPKKESVEEVTFIRKNGKIDKIYCYNDTEFAEALAVAIGYSLRTIFKETQFPATVTDNGATVKIDFDSAIKQSIDATTENAKKNDFDYYAKIKSDPSAIRVAGYTYLMKQFIIKPLNYSMQFANQKVYLVGYKDETPDKYNIKYTYDDNFDTGVMSMAISISRNTEKKRES